MVINSDELLKLEPIKGMATRKISEHGVSYGLGEAGYDIRIKQDILFSPSNPDYRWKVERKDGDVQFPELFEGRFVLASAIEEFQMPGTLMGIVHDKSTWARRGLSVFNTVIEPGWLGHLTLELVYHGNEPLHIPAGSGIAQVVFHEVALPAWYAGKYQNQEDRPVEAKESK